MTNGNYPSPEEVKYRKETYTEGKKVILVRCDDLQAPPSGTFGKVVMVDDLGTVHVHWDNGRRLGMTTEDHIAPAE